MKRTKQWWASLTKEERSELHCLDYANSNWLNRANKNILNVVIVIASVDIVEIGYAQSVQID